MDWDKFNDLVSAAESHELHQMKQYIDAEISERSVFDQV